MKTGLAFCTLTLALAFFCESSQAALGETESSLEWDQSAVSAVSRKATPRGSYTVHEMTSDGGLVREFVSPEGTIFAVAWEGITHPDLSILLGSYYNETRVESQRLRKTLGRAQHPVTTNNVVVERWGHMRAVHGRAYVPALVPEGVDPDELR